MFTFYWHIVLEVPCLRGSNKVQLVSLVYTKICQIYILSPKRHVLFYYWASEASPTLGCSIEISRDILYMSHRGKKIDS